MILVRGDFPKVGWFIPDGDDLGVRIPFRYRMVSDSTQFFNSPVGGLLDIGSAATIVTGTKFTMKNKSKVIINDILYSVKSITPFITDSVTEGLVKQKLLAEYVVQLG